MKLQDYRETFYTFSGKASDISRQLAFAGIAVIWLFKKDVAGQPSLPPQLILPGLFIVASLAIDLLHYCVGAVIWRCFYRSKEKAHIGEETDFEHSPALELPIWSLFIAKMIGVAIAYWLLGRFLYGIFLGTPAA